MENPFKAETEAAAVTPERVSLSQVAQSLVSEFVRDGSRDGGGAPPEATAFKRNLTLSRVRTPYSPTSHASSSVGDSPSSANLNVRLSYRFDDSLALDGFQTAQADGAARKIQRAWRAYRLLQMRSFCQFGGEAVRLVERFISGRMFSAERAASKAHLILHFDINKTILMSDAAKGASQADMVNLLLSECAWGRMTVGPEWVPVGRLATDRPESDPQLMTYRNFLDSFRYPYLEGTSEEVLRENMRRKKLCSTLQKTFTNPGEPGEMFIGVFHALSSKLAQPDTEDGPHNFFPGGQRRILPSFFELLLHLHATGRSFTVVFRSFGTDIKDVAHEINMFATGQHPSYPGVRLDGSDGRTDLRISIPEQSGAYVRWGHGPGESMLALGVDEAVLETHRMSRQLLEETAAACGGITLTGFEDIYAAFDAMASPHKPTRPESAPAKSAAAYIRRTRRAPNCAYALRDYYHFWKSRNERPRAGKLLLCDPEDNAVIQMFFDDNINYSQAHIADARNVRTGQSIPFSRAKNAFLIRAEPINAILDPKFFVRAVSEAELTILRQLEYSAIGKGASYDHRTEALPGSPFRSPMLAHLHRVQQSGVARVSLRAKQRWEWALRRVLIGKKVMTAINDTTR